MSYTGPRNRNYFPGKVGDVNGKPHNFPGKIVYHYDNYDRRLSTSDIVAAGYPTT